MFICNGSKYAIDRNTTRVREKENSGVKSNALFTCIILLSREYERIIYCIREKERKKEEKKKVGPRKQFSSFFMFKGTIKKNLNMNSIR